MFSVYFASDRSSSGKSIVTMAFSMMLKDLGYSISVYKTGPDFIDPIVLSEALNVDLNQSLNPRQNLNNDLNFNAIGIKNLDQFLIPEKYLKDWFFSGEENYNHNYNYINLDSKKAFVVESAMGLYDGNSYAIPKKFKLPVVLIMDSRRISSTMASLVYGLKNYKKGLDVCGVILNKISSKRHYEIILNEIKNNVNGVEVFGYILNDESVFSIKERHLGLTASFGKNDGEKKIFKKTVLDIKEAIFKNVDFNLMIKTLQTRTGGFNKLFDAYIKKNTAGKNRLKRKIEDEGDICENDIIKKNHGSQKSGNNVLKRYKTKIAVALDKAFYFYYNFNLEILKSFGAEIVFFSPLSDKSLPEGTSAVYIGGGYPEIYAGTLAENAQIRKEIYNFFRNNGIIYAECGGLMYLCKKITYKGQSFDAAGIFPFNASMDGSRLSLGYRTVRLKEKTFLGEAGLKINGHEFHYSRLLPLKPYDSEDGENKYNAFGYEEPLGGCGDIENIKNAMEYESISEPGVFKPEGYNILNTVGSYIHLSFYSNKILAENIVKNAKLNFKIY